MSKRILHLLYVDEPFVETFQWEEAFEHCCPMLSGSPCSVHVCSECGFHYATFETLDDRKPWYYPASGLCQAHAKSRAIFGHPYVMLPLLTFYDQSLEAMLRLPDDLLIREFLFLLQDEDVKNSRASLDALA